MSPKASPPCPPRAPHLLPSQDGAGLARRRLDGLEMKALTEQIQQQLLRIETNSSDQKSVDEAVQLAWHALRANGFSDIAAIEAVQTHDWLETIDPPQRALAALALETIGWHQLRRDSNKTDSAARLFDRCLELEPHNQRALERFAIVVSNTTPEQFVETANMPRHQIESALSSQLSCKRRIDNILQDLCGISEAHLVGRTDETLTHVLETRANRERGFIFGILGHLSRINSVAGNLLRSGTHLSLATGAACCQLEMLGLPRDLDQLTTLLTNELDQDRGDRILHQKSEIVCEILEALATIFDSQWQIFKNYGARERSEKLSALLREISDGVGRERS